jgi:hypothetical protein
LANAASIWAGAQQPIECGVELVFVDLAEVEHRAEAGRGGGRVERFGGGELGDRRNQARHHHGDHQIAATVASWTQQAIEFDPAKGAEHGRAMAVRQRTFDGDGLLAGWQHGTALEHRAQTLDHRDGPVADVQQGALLDLAIDLVALPQEDRFGTASICTAHFVHMIIIIKYSVNITIYMATFRGSKTISVVKIKRFTFFLKGSAD